MTAKVMVVMFANGQREEFAGVTAWGVNERLLILELPNEKRCIPLVHVRWFDEMVRTPPIPEA